MKANRNSLKNSKGKEEWSQINNEASLQVLVDDVLYTSSQPTSDITSRMVDNCTGPSLPDLSSTEHDERSDDAFVPFRTDIRDAYILSLNDTSLASIVEKGQGINPRLTSSSENDGRQMEMNMAFNV